MMHSRFRLLQNVGSGTCMIIVFFLSMFAELVAQNNVPMIYGPQGLEVNSYTGNLYYSRTDLSIPFNDMPLKITLAYNSGAEADFALGYGWGWSLSYHMHYALEGDYVYIKKPDGCMKRYFWDGSVYVPPEGTPEKLEQYLPGKFRLINNSQIRYYFDDSTHKKLTSIVNSRGNTVTLTYSNGYPVRITDPVGRYVTLTWSGSFLQSITDANVTPSRTINFTYNELGFLTGIADPEGATTSFTYGGWKNMTSITDGRGNTASITYSGVAVSAIETPLSRLSITYDIENKQTILSKQVSSGLRTTAYKFDDKGNLIKTTDPMGNFETYEYDSLGRMIKHTNFNGVVTTLTYDSKGNNSSFTDAMGTRTFSYDTTFNKIKTVTDRRGYTITYTYDAHGNLTGILYPNSKTESFTYDEYGNVLTITDGNNHVITKTYDSYGNMLSYSTALGTLSFTYDNAGNRTSFTNPLNKTYYYSYDKLGRIKSFTDPLSGTKYYTYDENGNTVTYTDENGNTQTVVYNALNQGTSITTTAGTVNYAYSETGQLTSFTDASGHTTTFTYNANDKLIEITEPGGFTQQFSYDANNNVQTHTNQNGIVTTYTYNGAGIVSSISSDGNITTFGYDAEGNRTSAANADVNINYTYDELNRYLSKSVSTWGKSIHYTYDDAGNRKTMTAPDGGVTNYTYDEENRLTHLKDPAGQEFVFSYNNSGNTTRQDNPNGTYTTFTYDNCSRLTDVVNKHSNNDIISSFHYTCDAVGNRKSSTDKYDSLTYFIYDNSDRLTQVTFPGTSFEKYSYDSRGNKTKLIRNTDTIDYIYDGDNRLTTAGTVEYIYDNCGNMIKKISGLDTTFYSYNSANRVTIISYPNKKTSSFVYEPEGLLLSKTDTSGSTTRYIHDVNDVLMEIDESGTTINRYITGIGHNELLAVNNNGTYGYYHRDGAGNITAISLSDESIGKTYSYNPFGDIQSETGSFHNSYCFGGRKLDKESGLYMFAFNMYDPKVDRYVSPALSNIQTGAFYNINKYNNSWSTLKLIQSPYSERAGNHILNTEAGKSIPAVPYSSSNMSATGKPRVGGKYGWIVTLIAVGCDLISRGCSKEDPPVQPPQNPPNQPPQNPPPNQPPQIPPPNQPPYPTQPIIPPVFPPPPPSNPVPPGGVGNTYYNCVIIQVYHLPNCPDGTGCGKLGNSGNPPCQPIELYSFNAEFKNGFVRIDWKTAQEINNYGFNIYRSLKSDTGYLKLNPMIIPGSGNSNTPHQYAYTDSAAYPATTYYYKLQQVDMDGSFKWYGPFSMNGAKMLKITDYKLYPNHPNPFNSTTAIAYQIPNDGWVTITVYDIAGREVKKLIDKNQSTGYYEEVFNCSGLASGVYMYRIVVRNGSKISYTKTGNMLLLK